MPSDGFTTLSIRVPVEVRDRVKALAVAEGVTVQSLLEPHVDALDRQAKDLGEVISKADGDEDAVLDALASLRGQTIDELLSPEGGVEGLGSSALAKVLRVRRAEVLEDVRTVSDLLLPSVPAGA